MKIKRRQFIKSSFTASIGALIIPPFMRETKAMPPNFKPVPENWSDTDITISWIGHSTVLINLFGKWVITDPVLFERIGIYLFGTNYGPSRYTAPALNIEEVPKPDIILLSHAHMDHMDYLTLKTFAEMYPSQIDCITAYNTKDVIEDLKWKSLKEMDWSDEHSIGDINFKALQVKHFGWRYPWEKDRSRGYMKDGRSYNAYIIERKGKKILFGGDTAFMKSFKNLNHEIIDIAIMPIGAYNPWKMNHCDPEEALIMAGDANAKYFIPIHCNTFKQGIEPRDEPLSWVKSSADNYDIELGIKAIGETFQLNHKEKI